jgi:SHS2 domain-containing protein
MDKRKKEGIKPRSKISLKKYVFLEHRADMFIEAYGTSFEKALENTAEGLFETISNSKKLKMKKKIIISEIAENLTDLTTYLLSKIVSEGDAREMMFRKMKVKKFSKEKGHFIITVEVFGQEALHKLGKMYVKAVTHHEASVKCLKGKWTIKILLDI